MLPFIRELFFFYSQFYFYSVVATEIVCLLACFLCIIVETVDENSQPVAFNQFSTFVVGAGNFGGPQKSTEAKPIVNPPARAPDAAVSEKTCIDQVDFMCQSVFLQWRKRYSVVFTHSTNLCFLFQLLRTARGLLHKMLFFCWIPILSHVGLYFYYHTPFIKNCNLFLELILTVSW